MSNDLADLNELVTLIQDKGSRGSDSRARARRDWLSSAPEVARSSAEGATKDSQMWAIYGGKNYSACERAADMLPPGQYTINHSDEIGIYFRLEDINLDELIHLPDSKSEEVINEISKFWTLEQQFRNFGFLWKRGVLLWGVPGGGKTSTLQIISKNIVDRGGISIYVDNPSLAAKALKILRQVEPKRPIVIMLEDLDAIIDEHGESDVLALMDGELQIDNVVFVATTNYPERLDKRLVNRPSRFDIIKKIDPPTSEARQLYFTSKNERLNAPEAIDELKQWVSSTKGFSIAHLKELIISVEVFGQPLSVAVERLRAMRNTPSSESTGNGVGFISSGE